MNWHQQTVGRNVWPLRPVQAKQWSLTFMYSLMHWLVWQHLIVSWLIRRSERPLQCAAYDIFQGD